MYYFAHAGHTHAESTTTAALVSVSQSVDVIALIATVGLAAYMIYRRFAADKATSK
ncbi:MAG TPA: hypothetical protein VF597_02595 [Candidatus Saccharimonadales bacterium]|jgi:hypothetical protein